jgi:hypothetical protein
MKSKILLSVSLISLMSTSAFAVPNPSRSTPPSTSAELNSRAASGAQKPEPLSGKVLETMNSGGYTYVKLQKKTGDKVWVAVPETAVKVGDQLVFKPGAEMRNFPSKGLKRTFDTIIFAEGILKPSAATAKGAGPGNNNGPFPAAPRTIMAKESKISVAKATETNAVTIEGAYGNSAKLDKKKVVVRGKVVKIAAGIMGKNWIHIQDGTGSVANRNYDLVCTTTSDLPNLGTVITVSGTLAKDRDFGAGYNYSAILENATFK